MKSIKLERISKFEIKLVGSLSKPKNKKLSREEIIGKIQPMVCNEIYSKGMVPLVTDGFKIKNSKRDVNFEFISIISLLNPIEDLSGLKIDRKEIEIFESDIVSSLSNLVRDTLKFSVLKEGQKINSDDLVYAKVKVNNDLEFEVLLDEFFPEVRKAVSEVGETKVCETKLPVDFKYKKYSGKTVKLNLKITKALTAKLPEIDDSFAKSVGLSDVVSLIIHIITKLRLKKQRQIYKMDKEEICNKLLKKCKVEISDEALSVYLQKQKQNLMLTLKRVNWSDDEIDKYFIENADNLESQAIFDLKTNSIFSQLASYFGLKDYDYSRLSKDSARKLRAEDQIIDKIYDL